MKTKHFVRADRRETGYEEKKRVKKTVPRLHFECILLYYMPLWDNLTKQTANSKRNVEIDLSSSSMYLWANPSVRMPFQRNTRLLFRDRRFFSIFLCDTFTAVIGRWWLHSLRRSTSMLHTLRSTLAQHTRTHTQPSKHSRLSLPQLEALDYTSYDLLEPNNDGNQWTFFRFTVSGAECFHQSAARNRWSFSIHLAPAEMDGFIHSESELFVKLD